MRIGQPVEYHILRRENHKSWVHHAIVDNELWAFMVAFRAARDNLQDTVVMRHGVKLIEFGPDDLETVGEYEQSELPF